MLRRLSVVVRHAVLLAASVFFVFPLYWMFSGSLKRPIEIWAYPPKWIPSTLQFSNYTHLFRSKPVLQWALNSIIISLITVGLVVILSAAAGYGYAKKRFPGSRLLFSLIVATMMMPTQVTLVPLYKLCVSLGLVNTYAGVILPTLAYPFGVFIVRQFATTIPDELLEAAKIDGAGELRTFLVIVIPMLLPALGVLAIFAFMHSWNAYLWQLVILQSESMLTLPVGVSTMIYEEITINYGMAMTGATIAAIPLILFFLALQKSFIQGITLGSIKG